MKRSIIFLLFNIIGFLGLLLFIAIKTEGTRIRLTSQELHEIVLAKNYVITDSLLSIMDNATIIDLRTPEDYLLDHHEGAVNIPVSELLLPVYSEIYNSSYDKVILSDDPIKAHESWMLLTQLGYENIFVLENPVSNP